MITEYLTKFASSAGKRFFKVRIISSTQVRHLDGVVRAAAAGDELIVDEDTAGQIAGRAVVLHTCDALGNSTATPKDEVDQIPEPIPAGKSPYGEPVFDAWFQLAEQLRILRERARLVEGYLAKRKPSNTPETSWHDATKRAVSRATARLGVAKDAIAAFDHDALAKAHLRCGQVVIDTFDQLERARDALEDSALRLFALRVEPLGLTQAGVSKLFGNSALYVKYVVQPLCGPSRRLAWDETGSQRDFCPEPCDSLYRYLVFYRERLANISNLQRELDAETARAAKAIRKPAA